MTEKRPCRVPREAHYVPHRARWDSRQWAAHAREVEQKEAAYWAAWDEYEQGLRAGPPGPILA